MVAAMTRRRPAVSLERTAMLTRTRRNVVFKKASAPSRDGKRPGTVWETNVLVNVSVSGSNATS